MTFPKPRVCLCTRFLSDMEHTYKDGDMSSKSAFRHTLQTPIGMEGPIDAVTQDRASTKAVIQLPGRSLSMLASHRKPGLAVLVYTTKHGYLGKCLFWLEKITVIPAVLTKHTSRYLQPYLAGVRGQQPLFQSQCMSTTVACIH